MLRQFDAILGTGSLMRYTRRISAPTVVIHGTDDPMVRPRNGRNLARAIPGARFVVVDGMGHDLPEPVWRPIVEALTENFAMAALTGYPGRPCSSRRQRRGSGRSTAWPLSSPAPTVATRMHSNVA